MSGRSVWQENAGAEGSRETLSPLRSRKKALKSEAQERGRLKDAFEDERAYTVKRVAKP
jgi:hypothetical protein